MGNLVFTPVAVIEALQILDIGWAKPDPLPDFGATLPWPNCRAPIPGKRTCTVVHDRSIIIFAVQRCYFARVVTFEVVLLATLDVSPVHSDIAISVSPGLLMEKSWKNETLRYLVLLTISALIHKILCMSWHYGIAL